MEQRSGQIIILNGPSSAGKSSTARAVQENFAEPYLALGIDTLLEQMLPASYNVLGERSDEGFYFEWIADAQPPMRRLASGQYGERTIAGLHAAIASLARMGHNIVVDHVLVYESWVRDLVRRLTGLPVLIVGLYCPIEIIMHRRHGREGHPQDEDAALAMARWWTQHVHALVKYDLELDTSQVDPAGRARAIHARLDAEIALGAFRGLVERFGADDITVR